MIEEDFFDQKRKTNKVEQQKKYEEEEKQRLEEQEEKRKLEEQKQQQKPINQDKEISDKVSESEARSSNKDGKGSTSRIYHLLINSQGQTKGQKRSKSKKAVQQILKPEVMVQNTIGKPYFLVPDSTPAEIDKQLLYDEDNKVRRWSCFISEIKLENLQKESLSVFLNFRIGQIGKNKNRFEDVSSDEIFFKSEIAKDVKRSETKVIKVMFHCEMNLSYQMLKERYFVIEVWEYQRFKLNLFLGKINVQLVSIASGNIKRSDNIKKAFGEKRQFARIYYNILFQEVWDYKITFEAWKGQNILGDEGAKYDPKIKLTLMTDDLINPRVESDVIKKEKNPNFKNLKGFMHYRGTMESLTQQMVLVTLYKDAYFELSKKLVSLRGIQDTNYLKVQFRLKLKKPPLSQQKMIQKKLQQKRNVMEEEDEEEEDDDDLLQDQAIYSVIEGRINLNKIPRYAQIGELNQYIEEQYYLVVIINRLSNVLSPDDRGVINTFLTVSWRDQSKTTAIVKNNPNPTYNEELYFRMPIMKQELTLDDIINQKTKESLVVDAIREELKNRPDITIQLWLDGADIMTDESLGYCRIMLAELQNAQKYPKTMVTDDNRKYSFETRLGTFTRKFQSGLFNVEHIQVTFQVCFAPDLPAEIDLRDFNSLPPDFFPAEIADQMQIGKEYIKNQSYKKWDRAIRQNFSIYGLEKNAYSIFFSTVFVKDQFDFVHFICKYLEKFYVRYQSQEATKELFANPEDIKMATLYELVHFVRNIPFIQDSFSKKDVWMSPDFFLKVRKGFIHDHAVLAACLFLGCELEDQEHALKKTQNYIPLENRTFVCLGTLKINSSLHAWVMTYSYNLDRVVLWDVQENKRFELVGRIQQNQKKKLRKLLYADKPPTSKNKGLLGLTQQSQKKSKKQIRREEMKKIRENEEKQKKMLAGIELERQRKIKEDEENQRKKDRQYAKFSADDVTNLEDLQIDLNQMGKQTTTVKVRNDRQLGLASGQSEVKQQSQVSGSKKTSKPMFQNPMFASRKQQSGGGEDKSALQMRLEAEEEKRMQNPTAKFTQEEKFVDNTKDVQDGFELPYATVEVIFNQRNMYANLGNQNPQQIFYHLHRKEDWLPYLIIEKLNEEEEDDDDDDNEDISDEDQMMDEVISVPWTQKIGAFYAPQILTEPIKKHKIKRILEDIYYEVKAGIEKTRAKLGMPTKWKHQEDKLNKKMQELLKILEYRDTNRAIRIIQRTIKNEDENDKLGKLTEEEVDSQKYDEIVYLWEKEVKSMMPLQYRMCLLPIKFTYTESEKMRSIIVENMTSFFLRKEKRIVFHLTGKIYNYPNKVNCVRLILGYTFCEVSEAIDLQDSEGSQSDEEVQNTQQKNQTSQQNQPILDKIDEEDDNDKKPLIPK